MSRDILKRPGFGHAALVISILAFHVWFTIDAWQASAKFENLMLVVPLTGLAFVLGLFILFGIVRRGALRHPEDIPRPIDRRIPLLMLALCAYVAGLITVGFDLSTFLFLAISLWLLGERRTWLILVYSATITAFCVFGLRAMVSIPVPTLLISGS